MNEVAKLESGSELMTQTAGAAVPELFVINLCASMTPMPAVPKNLKGFEKYKLYQVSRQEDGRRRFRLRLGFFTSEADAEWVLNSVRALYPTAFTGCVAQEDVRYASEASLPARTADDTQVRPALVVAKQIPPPPAAPVVKPAVAAGNSAKPVAVTTPTPAAAQRPLTLEVAQPAVPKMGPAATKQPAQPFHVARGVQLPETSLELTDEFSLLSALAAKPSNSANQTAIKPGMPTARSTPASPAANRPIIDAVFVNPPKMVDDYVPVLDTTLTIRTLTRTEAEDTNRPKWFAVQLALSEQPINLDTMPKLDIFAAYSLYSVAIMEEGTIKHALRLGFFRENVSAEAVMGYLKAFFKTPAITQISAAEYERFSEPKAKPASLESEARVVNLNDKRPTTPVKPAAPMTTQRPTNNATTRPVAAKPKDNQARMTPPPRPQSFLSRLIGRQLD